MNLRRKPLGVLALLCGLLSVESKAADSLRVNVQGALPALITSNTIGSTSKTLQLGGTVYPASVSQAVNWSVLGSSTASATVDVNGLLTVPAQTAGYVWVKAVSIADASKFDSIKVLVYCQPSHTNPINWFNIDTVKIIGTPLNSGTNTIGNAGAYTLFPATGNTTAVFQKGSTYTVNTQVTSSVASIPPDTTQMTYSVSAWIDYNRNGIFESSEWISVEDSATSRYASQTFTVPASAQAGYTLMRVRSRLQGSSNGVADMCLGYTGSGQTEDYIIRIAPTNNGCAGDPGPNPGDMGCVTFTYRGIVVTYPTVRGTDGKIWLQKNLGAANVATALADSTAYGDLFQWGRWDDGHQLRNSATSSVMPVSNNPSGLGTGSNVFYLGTGTTGWWSVKALTDTWSETTPATVSATNGCDPCKQLGTGWHLPSSTEWQAIVTAESMTNPATAFSSYLKLPANGNRTSSGGFDYTGTRGYYWSNETSNSGGKYLYVGTTVAPNPNSGAFRGQGSAIRCMKASTTVDSVKVSVVNQASPVITTHVGTLPLTATVYPALVFQGVTWSITNGTGMATISANGVVTAQSNGTVWAKAISVQDITKKDSILITISNQANYVDSVVVTTAAQAAPAITTHAGFLQMNAAVYPVIANQNVTWSIVPVTGSATVNNTGLVVAQTNGTVWAKATSVQNTAKADSMLITISGQIVPIDSVVVQTAGNVAPVITTLSGTLQMNGLVYPASASQAVNWSVQPVTGQASVSNTGVVTAMVNGTVWVKALSVQDITKFDSVQVTISGQIIAIDSVVVSIASGAAPELKGAGDTLQLAATVYPLTVNSNVTWSTVALDGQAQVSSNGLVMAQTAGKVWVKAVSVQDAGKSDSVLITIKAATTGISPVKDALGITIYPNPAHHTFQVVAQMQHPTLVIAIYDLQGRVMEQRAVAPNALNTPVRFNTQQYAKGTYLIRITGGEAPQGFLLGVE